MKLNGLTKNLQPTIAMAAGAVGGSYAQKLIPFGNDKVKSAIVIAVGLFLSSKKGMLGNVGQGLAVGGFVNLAKSMGIGGGDLISGMEDARFIQGIQDLAAGGSIMGMHPQLGSPAGSWNNWNYAA